MNCAERTTEIASLVLAEGKLLSDVCEKKQKTKNKTPPFFQRLPSAAEEQW